jgi:signal transduction histidine kinase
LSSNLLVFGQLVFRDLGARMRKEAISGARDRALQLAQRLADEGQIDLYKVHQKVTVVSEYVKEVLTRDWHVKEFTLYDAGNRAIGSWTRQGGTIFQTGQGFHPLNRRPQSPELPDAGDDAKPTLKVDTTESDSYYKSVRIPGRDNRGMVEVGIDEDQLGREIDDLRRSLMLKIAAGAIISVILLLVAFAYVIRLLAKTRRLEAEAQMADRLAYVGTLASGLAHEIRNPLNAMNMNLQMLEEELSPIGAAPDASSLLSSTKGEVRRLEGLVNDFLSYARPVEPRLEPRDLNLTVDEVARFLRAALNQKGIAIETSLQTALPTVAIDEAQIRQALMNIVINAKDVLGEGGKIEIATALGSQSDVVVRVKDNGPGIAPEMRQKIFEVFYSTRGGGTGLGLPIAQKILESHGGWVELESEVGVGTCFILHIPRAPRPEPKAASQVAHAR